MSNKIRKILRDFSSSRKLPEHVKNLFGELGYKSAREHPSDVRHVLETHTPLSSRQRELLAEWRSSDFLFQLTDEEIASQNIAQKFDGERIKSFLFVAIELKRDYYSRTELAENTRMINRPFKMPAIVLFKHSSALTLAAAHRRPHECDKEKDVLGKVTLIKDIGIENPHRAHIDLLNDISLHKLISEGVSTFDKLHERWEQILDIDKLNKKFYKDLSRWFEKAVDKCDFPNDGKGKGSNERHIIRLITRILFIWFLKEKNLVSSQLFEESFARKVLKRYSVKKDDYYRAVLQNLFFATLNTEIEKRTFSKSDHKSQKDFNKYRYSKLLANPDDFIKTLQSIPFINGGLFDCLDNFIGDKCNRIDNFDDINLQKQNKLVPSFLFFDGNKQGLFSILNSYKFTVEESTPLDLEVALDPELLGRVFENLLAAYNPETRNTARKSTGSYYTPRYIVDYMADEVLADTLANKVNMPKKRIYELLEYTTNRVDFNESNNRFNKAENELLIQSISKLRILDPAVGSGAFPMSILNKLTLALRRLDPTNQHWDSDYARKLHLMQNNIFGVDIQPIACQIAKLRFFISLLIEQKTDSTKKNCGLSPLPNLEICFVAANTLIGLEKQGLESSDSIKIKNELKEIRKNYFNAHTRNHKYQLRNKDDELRKRLKNEFKTGFGNEGSRSVSDWNPYDQNLCSAWFDPQWMFGVSDGFDIIIGNPPYVESRSPNFPNELKNQYQKEISKWQASNLIGKGADLLIYFFPKTIEFMKNEGQGCFITQNSYLYSEYGKKFQKFAVQNFSITKIVDSNFRLFQDKDGPNINTIISFFSKMPGVNLEIEKLVEQPTASAKLNTRKFPNRNLTDFKWGFLFEAPKWFIEEFCIPLKKYTPIQDIRVGVGLINIQLNEAPLIERNIPKGMVPFMKKEIYFDLKKTKRMVHQNKREIPTLILPRGIGRHFCSFNTCNALTNSYVEIYLSDGLKQSNFPLCLWLYLNSSITWLFRELAGRKNLGGGMLKAEAIDLKEFPMKFKFDLDFASTAQEIFKSLKKRAPMKSEEEIFSSEHKKIDQTVLKFLKLEKYESAIVDSLLKLIDNRTKKAKSSD